MNAGARMKLVNPFTGVSREEHEQLLAMFFLLGGALQDAGREIVSLRQEVMQEVDNGERLTALAARAIVSADILQEALIERQIGKQHDQDPNRVLIANLPEKKKERPRFMRLQKRRRIAAKKRNDEAVRRNALPKLLATLPPMPLTAADREAMKDAVAETARRLAGQEG